MSLIFLIKSPISLIYHLLPCTTGLSWKFKNSETFSVGDQHFEITGLPGTLEILWCRSKHATMKQSALTTIPQ